MAIKPLKAAQVYRRCDPAAFKFETTAELKPPARVIGQERAVQALELGLGIRQEGYNLFVLGSVASGRHSIVQQFLGRRAATEATPDDWVYVYNFETPHRPKALRLPPGAGATPAPGHGTLRRRALCGAARSL